MILWLAACRPDETPRGPTFARLAERAGYTVQQGSFGRFEEPDCCELGDTCVMNDPQAPYLAWFVPPSPGQVTPDPYPDADGASPVFHLRSDEALVFTGTTPPESEYWSFRSYLYDRVGERDPMTASLGPSLNDLVVAAATGGAPPGEPIAIVTTMDAAVERQVIDWLAEVGWDRSRVFADRIPYSLVRSGLGGQADTFAVLARAGGFANSLVGAAWLDDPGATVLRLSPRGAEQPPAEPFDREPLPPSGTGGTEELWHASLDALTDAVTARFSTRTAVSAYGRPFDLPTYDCIDQGDCRFENHDRYYAQLPPNKLAVDGSFVVLLGVNHRRTHKASYETVVINSVETLGGMYAVEADQLVGTARAYVSDDPKVDDLYAVIVARDCAGAPSLCVQIPTTCPGLDPALEMAIDYRIWLEPSTGSAPLSTELLPERALLFGPAH